MLLHAHFSMSLQKIQMSFLNLFSRGFCHQLMTNILPSHYQNTSFAIRLTKVTSCYVPNDLEIHSLCTPLAMQTLNGRPDPYFLTGIYQNLKQRLNIIYFSLIRYCLFSYFYCYLAPRQNNMTSELMGK